MSKLREAAQAVMATESLPAMVLAMERLRDALAEDRLDEMQALTESEYEIKEDRIHRDAGGTRAATAIRARGNT
jgi:hypothetical protein